MALALSRKAGQAIKIGENIIITVGETRGSYTTVLIDAPKDISVARIEGNNDGAGSGSSKGRARRRAGEVLHRLPAQKGRSGAVAGAETGASCGGDSPAAAAAQRHGCGAVVGGQPD